MPSSRERSASNKGSAARGAPRSLDVTSPDFAAGERIAKRHAHAPEGQDVAPVIVWNDAPNDTVSFALVCDDPDAPRKDPWVHWVIHSMPGDATSTRAQGVEGKNDYGDTGWGGPFPPEGHGTHHYRFHVYALDTKLELGPGATKKQLLDAIRGHVLAEGELVATYSR